MSTHASWAVPDAMRAALTQHGPRARHFCAGLRPITVRHPYLSEGTSRGPNVSRSVRVLIWRKMPARVSRGGGHSQVGREFSTSTHTRQKPPLTNKSNKKGTGTCPCLTWQGAGRGGPCRCPAGQALESAGHDSRRKAGFTQCLKPGTSFFMIARSKPFQNGLGVQLERGNRHEVNCHALIVTDPHLDKCSTLGGSHVR